MPTERFRNLDREKQQRIIEAVMDEFTEYGLDQATVAGIISRAGIPRGSFYQYFNDMEDAWSIVYDLLGEQKMAAMQEAIAAAGQVPFLEFFRITFQSALRFSLSNPQLVRLGSHLYRSQSQWAVRQVKRGKAEGISFYVRYIEADKAKGLIRPSVDSAFLARLLINATSEEAIEQICQEDLNPEEIMCLVDRLVDILKHGILGEEA